MFENLGFEFRRNAFSQAELKQILISIDSLEQEKGKGGIRNLEKKSSFIGELVKSETFLGLARGYVSGEPKVVRVILFDKSKERNWGVIWHQDKTVTLSRPVNWDGWGPQTMKDGIPHIQPPIGVLNDMVTLRIHLDLATKDNGCLKVLPSSHKQGLLSEDALSKLDKQNASYCEAEAGDVLIMKPHLVHGSEKSVEQSRRRVIHIEYAGYSLPEGVTWG